MLLLRELFSSNIFLVVLTFLSGFALFYLYIRVPYSGVAIALFAAVGIFVSYVFNVGEAYEYNQLYKRAFFYFGDDISTALIAPFVLALAHGAHHLAFYFLLAIVLSGAKIALILTAAFIVTLWVLDRKIGGRLLRKAMALLTIAIPVKFSLDLASSEIQTTQFGRYLAEHFDADMGKGRGVCHQASVCWDTQFGAPVSTRLTSSLMGLKMTLDGGVKGAEYPSTPERFAQFALIQNPWGINERFKLSKEYWYRVGQIQTAYLHFGSGYGWQGLLALAVVFGGVAFIARHNSRASPGEATAVIFALYLTLVIMNQFNPWLASGSKNLILVGFCVASILSQRRSLRQFRGSDL